MCQTVNLEMMCCLEDLYDVETTMTGQPSRLEHAGLSEDSVPGTAQLFFPAHSYILQSPKEIGI